MTRRSRGRRAGCQVALGLLVCLNAACGGPDRSADADRDPSPTSGAPVSTTTTPGPCTLPVGTTRGVLGEATLTSGGLERNLLEYVPPSDAPSMQRFPLIIDLHGYAENRTLHAQHTDLVRTAGEHGFVYLVPEGTGTPAYWNSVGRPTGPDDVGFVADLIDRAVADRCVDPSRVYVVGMSNGAMLASQVACRLSTKVAAIAAVAGLDRPPGCEPRRPVPVIAFHGGDDGYVLPGGGFGDDAMAQPLLGERLTDDTGRGPPAVRTAAEEWAAGNGCDPAPTGSEPVAGVQLLSWTGCRGGAEVQLYLTPHTGHVWPGSQLEHAFSALTGAPNDLIDANELLWAFAELHGSTG